MNVQIRLFAQARDLAGRSVVELELPENSSAGDVRLALGQQIPALNRLLPHLLIAIDEAYAEDDAPVPAGATIACFPPVSGG